MGVFWILSARLGQGRNKGLVRMGGVQQASARLGLGWNGGLGLGEFQGVTARLGLGWNKGLGRGGAMLKKNSE